jgi:hypothetical protein
MELSEIPPTLPEDVEELDNYLDAGGDEEALIGRKIRWHGGAMGRMVRTPAGMLSLELVLECEGVLCRERPAPRHTTVYVGSGLHSGAWCYVYDPKTGEYLANLRDQSYFCDECAASMQEARTLKVMDLLTRLDKSLNDVDELSVDLYQSSGNYDQDAYALRDAVARARIAHTNFKRRWQAKPPTAKLTHRKVKESIEGWRRLLAGLDPRHGGFIGAVERQLQQLEAKPEQNPFPHKGMELYVTTDQLQALTEVAHASGHLLSVEEV